MKMKNTEGVFFALLRNEEIECKILNTNILHSVSSFLRWVKATHPIKYPQTAFTTYLFESKIAFSFKHATIVKTKTRTAAHVLIV